ncbi:MAG: protein phosphatase 2C domain-containing protein [Bacteroidales bacterium]|nr:protein phosphatase 2C domain-containing protein [Bacteroidales bacterium]
MSKETNLTIAAQCDRAARDGANEDNCLVMSEVGCANPSVNHFGDVTAESLSKMIPLRGKGCLLVVADGMGGMNAGEVASQIAVTTIAKCFSEENMKNLEMTEPAIKKFIRKTIVSADDAIKKAAAKDKEKDGMGTTVALLWILANNTAYYAWCGDSRIYTYSPNQGLRMLSHDHSYVMEVLHLCEEDAFVHPNNNIITRSLGNPAEKANPEIEGPIQLYQNDLFLLCSDGLCGVLPTREMEGVPYNIEDVIKESIPDADHLKEGIEALWTAAAAAGWHDNVTTLLCQVKSGPERPEIKSKVMRTSKNPQELLQSSKSSSKPSPQPSPHSSPQPSPHSSSQPSPQASPRRSRKGQTRWMDTAIALLAVVLVLGGGLTFFYLKSNHPKTEIETQTQDSTVPASPRDARSNVRATKTTAPVPTAPKQGGQAAKSGDVVKANNTVASTTSDVATNQSSSASTAPQSVSNHSSVSSNGSIVKKRNNKTDGESGSIRDNKNNTRSSLEQARRNREQGNSQIEIDTSGKSH